MDKLLTKNAGFGSIFGRRSFAAATTGFWKKSKKSKQASPVEVKENKIPFRYHVCGDQVPVHKTMVRDKNNNSSAIQMLQPRMVPKFLNKE